jgi:hypothetical protein
MQVLPYGMLLACNNTSSERHRQSRRSLARSVGTRQECHYTNSGCLRLVQVIRSHLYMRGCCHGLLQEGRNTMGDFRSLRSHMQACTDDTLLVCSDTMKEQDQCSRHWRHPHNNLEYRNDKAWVCRNTTQAPRGLRHSKGR